jgi:hypothetical protein
MFVNPGQRDNGKSPALRRVRKKYLKRPMKNYHFSLGNSTEGPLGFCATVRAQSKAAAVTRLKELLPEELEVKPEGLEGGEYVTIFLNSGAINARDIDEAEEASVPK